MTLRLNSGGTSSGVVSFMKLYDVATETVKQGQTGAKGFATGFTKGLLSTLKGAGELGTKIGQFALDDLLESITGKGLPTADIFTEGTEANLLAENILEAKTGAEKFGKGTEQVAEFAVPASKLAKVEKGIGFGTKVASRALSSGTVASIQEGEIGTGTVVAGATEAIIPGVGKVLKPVSNV